MTEYSKNISFWNLLSSKKIVIPIIQRDYAQGRIGKEYLRKRFLSQLFTALQEDGKLELDFVYGSVEKDTFYPLDGQQRLTTLWLLHWYLSLCAGTLNEDKAVLQRFSYETRTSSRDFCRKLCEINEIYEPKVHGIAAFIRDQHWYYSAYEQDPTIQSMLRMLEGTDIKDSSETDITDGIEEFVINKCAKENVLDLLNRLKDEEASPIKFYLLNMEDKNMPLTDDLYIKMNARGKVLTDFENFKADLLKYKLNDGEYLISERSGFSEQMDNEWTDLFWRFRSTDNRIDDIYMSFINRFFLCWHIANTTSKQEDITSGELYKKLSTVDENGAKTDDCHYQSMTVYNAVLKVECIAAFTKCLSNLCNCYDKLAEKYGEENANQAMYKLFWPYWKSDKDESDSNLFYFIPHYREDETTLYPLTLQHQVVFYAICTYFVSCKKADLDKLKDWMHFVWNITENSSIDNKKQSFSAIRFFGNDINELPKVREASMPVNAVEDIISYLAGIDESQINKIFGQRQLLEEIAKAKQINEDSDWKEKIYKAETFAFFKGAIAFLFNDEKGNVDWTFFDKKMETARQLFDNGGVLADNRVKALHTLYSYCDDFNSQFWWDAKIFNWRASTWKENILTKVDTSYAYVYAKSVHHLLMGDEPYEGTKPDYIQLLASESFVKFLVKNKDNRDMYIRDPYYALHYCGEKCGVMLDQEIHETRYAVLSQLLDSKIIEFDIKSGKKYSISRVGDTDLIWGPLDINFVYHASNGINLHLQWYRVRNNNTYDIYLMTENWHYMERPTEMKEEEGDKQKYYCFNFEMPDDNTPLIDSFRNQVETEFEEFISKKANEA